MGFETNDLSEAVMKLKRINGAYVRPLRVLDRRVRSEQFSVNFILEMSHGTIYSMNNFNAV